MLKTGHRHLRSILTGLLLAGAVALSLSACITSDQSVEMDPRDPRAQDIADEIPAASISARAASAPTIARPQLWPLVAIGCVSE